VGATLTRIVSDVHYADRSSRVRSLEQLRPLFVGATSFVVNGDMLDTRASKDPAHTEKARRQVLEFFASAGIPVTFLTGNHDPDLSEKHYLEFADGQVLVTHGDVLFDNIVPWSKEAPMIRNKIIAALAALPEGSPYGFEDRLGVFRSVAASIPQRHQSERDPLKYAVKLAGDTIWPPHQAFSIMKSWREAPGRAAALARRHRPKAKFILIGHTHRPGVWKTASGVVVINTGSFTRFLGAMGAEISSKSLKVHRIVFKKGQFHRGADVASFPLS
jgi:predicted phosphodiesterase